MYNVHGKYVRLENIKAICKQHERRTRSKFFALWCFDCNLQLLFVAMHTVHVHDDMKAATVVVVAAIQYDADDNDDDGDRQWCLNSFAYLSVYISRLNVLSSLVGCYRGNGLLLLLFLWLPRALFSTFAIMLNRIENDCHQFCHCCTANIAQILYLATAQCFYCECNSCV